MDKKLTTNTFTHEYIKTFQLYNQNKPEETPSIEHFKIQILQMSRAGYDISAILTKLTYLHAKIAQVVFGNDVEMMKLLHKKL
jgi:hypothetical protein